MQRDDPIEINLAAEGEFGNFLADHRHQSRAEGDEENQNQQDDEDGAGAHGAQPLAF